MFNKFIASILPYFPKKFVWLFSKRYVSGETLEDAVKSSKELHVKGSGATIDLLGEFITELPEAETNKNVYAEIVERFGKEENLNVTFSIKPTSFGLLLDEELCYNYIREIIVKAQESNRLVQIDMEDSPCVDKELVLYKRLHAEFPKNVGLAIQAYLKRSDADVEMLSKMHTPETPVVIRLCKGIYQEPENIAFKKHDQINQKYLENLETFFKYGVYVGIATHDKFLVNGAYELIKKYDLKPEQYEFQMLYGVTPELRASIIKKGNNMRVYVPYGTDWFGYCTRRLKENPKMAGMIIKAIFIRG
ncbi:MAG: proline dehydrogenase family protein [Marinilabiliaceae bacterium]|nr:proline dehydrogenase family protein [Marinilabiliaceae bacterium]